MAERSLSEAELLKREAELLKRHPSPKSKIFLPTEKYNLAERVDGIAKVVDLYDNRMEQHKARLREIRQQFAGNQRCFIIGNGPSLNDTDLTKLKDEYTFGLNGIFLMYDKLPFRPTFYLVEDHLVAEDRAPSINQLTDSIRLFPGYLAYCIEEKPGVTFFHHRGRSNFKLGNYDFSTDASECTYAGCTVTFTAIQLAFYFGFKEIYLIGVDSNYDIPRDVAVSTGGYSVQTLDMKSDDPNHFHPDYFGKGFRWHDPQVDRMIAAYEKARDVALSHGVRVINATKGGKLESFPRVDYDALLDGKPVAIEKNFPRTVIVDLTSIGGNSATGQFKSALFQGWPESELAQVYKEGQRYRIQLPGKEPVPIAPSDIASVILAFKPDVIYARPVEQCPELFDILLKLCKEEHLPMVVHMMDDWPERLRIEDPAAYGKINQKLIELLAAAKGCLSICDSMSEAYKMRYGHAFEPIANGIDPREWPDIERQKKEGFILRYCGGLAADMGRDMVFAVAKLIDRINSENGPKIQFEIYTMKAWLKDAEEITAKLKGVSVKPLVPRAEYPRLLIDADFLLIAYNSDEQSVRYTRYSMANKLPDCFASGSPVLAIGPEEVATIAYLKKTGCGLAAADLKEFETNLRSLMQDSERRTRIGRAARCYVFQNHHINKISARFQSILETASGNGESAEDYLIGPFRRSRPHSFDLNGCLHEIAETVITLARMPMNSDVEGNKKAVVCKWTGTAPEGWAGPGLFVSQHHKGSQAAWRGVSRFDASLKLSSADILIGLSPTISEHDFVIAAGKFVREEKPPEVKKVFPFAESENNARLPKKLGAPLLTFCALLAVLLFASVGYIATREFTIALLFGLTGAALSGMAALGYVLLREIAILRNKNKQLAELVDRKARRLQETEAKLSDVRSKLSDVKVIRQELGEFKTRVGHQFQSLENSITKVQREFPKLEKQIAIERSERIAEIAHRDGGTEIPKRIFLLITTHRCGSTWLFDMMRAHPAFTLSPSYAIYEALGLVGGRYPLGLSNSPDARMLFENQAGVGTKIPNAVACDAPTAENFAIEKIHPIFFQNNPGMLVRALQKLEENGHVFQFAYQVRDPIATLASFRNYQKRSPGWYDDIKEEDLVPFMQKAYETIAELIQSRPGLVLDYRDIKEQPVASLERLFQQAWPRQDFHHIAEIAVSSTDREQRRQKNPTAFLGAKEGAGSEMFDRNSPGIEGLYTVYHRILAMR